MYTLRAIGAFEAKNKFGQLLDWVEAGEAVAITRRGKVVARLAPTGGALNIEPPMPPWSGFAPAVAA
jgi:prevent-host-death family protein